LSGLSDKQGEKRTGRKNMGILVSDENALHGGSEDYGKDFQVVDGRK
jgi:hypothetical protein